MSNRLKTRKTRNRANRTLGLGLASGSLTLYRGITTSHTAPNEGTA